MKVYEIGDQKGIGSLRTAERDDPVAGAGQALIKFHAHSLNYRDYMVLNGWYGPPQAETLIPVSDGAGEVVAIGDGVDSVSVGDRVCELLFYLDGRPLRSAVLRLRLRWRRRWDTGRNGCFPCRCIGEIARLVFLC